jgi:hypothetical protein
MKIITLLKSLFTINQRWEVINKEAERLRTYKENLNRVDSRNLNPVAQARTARQIAEGFPAEHLELPPEFKYEQQKPIELELGDNDILVLSYPKLLSQEHRENIRSKFEGMLEKEGKQIIVLDGGLTYSIIHRTKA